MIAFAAPITRPIATGSETRWQSIDGRWALIEIRSDYGRRPRRERIQLVRVLGVGEYTVGRFRCRRAAIHRARELTESIV
jgi:hypothetical protein